nr:hypothetical protein [Candidatus Microthrix sp.]
MPTPDPADRPYDVVLFGATGFVGRLTARHLAAHVDDSTRIALAGRSSVPPGGGPCQAWRGRRRLAFDRG